jgi:hypothetical protein
MWRGAWTVVGVSGGKTDIVKGEDECSLGTRQELLQRCPRVWLLQRHVVIVREERVLWGDYPLGT